MPHPPRTTVRLCRSGRRKSRSEARSCCSPCCRAGPSGTTLRRHAVGSNVVEEVVLLSDHAKVVPAQAEVQGQARRPAEAVLNVEPVAVFEGMAQGVARATCLAAARAMPRAGSDVRIVGKAKLLRGKCCPGSAGWWCGGTRTRTSRRAGRLPRVVVDEVPVGVHPDARHRLVAPITEKLAHA